MNILEKAKGKQIRFSVPAVLLSCFSVSALLWFVSVFRHGKTSIQCRFFFAGFKDFLADFLNVVGYSAYGDPYNCTAYTGLSEKGYPPLTYVLLRPFAGLVDIGGYYERNYFLDMYKEPLLLLMAVIVQTVLLLILFLLIFRYARGSNLKKGLIAGAMLLSKPVLFTLERGNVILLAAVCTAYFLFHYDDSSRIRKETALIALGIAFALKLSPAALGFLLLVNKQFREAVRAALYGLLFLLAPFLLLKGGFSNVPLFFRNMKLLLESYGSDRGEVLEYCLRELHFPAAAQYAAGITSAFAYLICALLLFFCFFYRRRWEKVLAVSLVLLLAPSFSGHYCVLYLIPAAVLFLTETQYRPLDWLAAGAFLLMFSLYYPGVLPEPHYLTFVYLLTVLMLLYGLFAVIRTNLERKHSSQALKDHELYRFVTGLPRNKRTAAKHTDRKKPLLILAAVLLTAALGVRLYPFLRDYRTYRRGVSQLAQGSYREAIDTFTALGSFRDSAAQADACRQELSEAAAHAEADGDYGRAADLLRIAPDFSDYRNRLADLLDAHPELIGTGDRIRFADRLWTVLEYTDSEMLLMSAESVSTQKFYDNPDAVSIDWNDPDALEKAISQSTHPPLTWADSSVRKWLRDEWLPQLPADAAARIIPCQIHTPANPTYGTAGGDDTEDTVYLLSAQEFLQYTESCDFDTGYSAALLRSTGKKEGTAAFFIDNDLYDMGGFNDVLEGQVFPVIRISRI